MRRRIAPVVSGWRAGPSDRNRQHVVGLVRPSGGGVRWRCSCGDQGRLLPDDQAATVAGDGHVETQAGRWHERR